MRLVVDASVAIKWFVDEEFSERAGALLEGKTISTLLGWLQRSAMRFGERSEWAS